MWNQSSPTVLDYFEQNSVPDNIKIWYHVWTNLFDEKLNHYYYGFEPVSFRFALKQIIDLLELHNLKNTEFGRLKPILIQKLDYVLKIDYISKELFKSEIDKLYTLIKLSSKEKPKEEEIVYLSKYILGHFKRGWYFNEVFNKLKKELFQDSECSIRQIQILSQLLIIELVEKGINIHTVQKLLSNILSVNYNKVLNEYYAGRYFTMMVPYTLKEDSTFEERYEFIRNLYQAPKFKCKFVYLILGATSKNIKTLHIENMTFVDRLNIEGEDTENNNSKLWVFDFQEKDFENKPFLRVMIEDEGIDIFEMYDNTRNEIYKTIEFFKYKHSYSDRVKLKMSQAWAALDETGKILHQLPSLNDSGRRGITRYEKFELLDRIQYDYDVMKRQGLEYGLNKRVLENNKIYVILEWINKAENNYKHLENYFTSLWFALENLVRTKNQTVIESINNYIPAFFANNFLDTINNDIHEVHSMSIALGRMQITDIELGKSCGLISDDGHHYNWNSIDYGYNMSKFIPNIKDIYVKRRTKEVSEFYANKELLKSTINIIYERIKYEFNLMYKLRNDIVHSGGVKAEFFGYYCIRLKQTLELILDRVVWELNHYPDKKIDEILGSQQFIYELLLKRIDENEKLNHFHFR